MVQAEIRHLRRGKGLQLERVWVDMMRHARFLYDDKRGLPVDDTFRTFEDFVLWATTSQGYRMGHNDAYRLERRDIHAFGDRTAVRIRF